MSGARSFLLVVQFISFGFVYFALGATIEETSSLIAAASLLGIAPGTWNFSTDPCVGRWTGIGCCSNSSQRLCCSFPQGGPQAYPPVPSITPCEQTADARVTTIIIRSDLFGNQVLNGTLPEALCNLTSLRILDVGLHRLRGEVPACIGTRLSNLRILRLGENFFTGTIPELGELSELQHLYLDSANITGSIPASLGRLSRLTYLSLRNNDLEGGIPPELGQLTNLVELLLQVNRLSGPIPESLGNLTNLQFLRLFNNELSGDVDSQIFRNMGSLLEVSFRDNRLSGSIPDFGFDALSRLQVIDFGFNNFSGALPDSLGNLAAPLPALVNLFLDHNRLDGSVPSSFGSLRALMRLDLSHNLLEGSLQVLGNNSQLTQLDASFNSFNISTAPGSLIRQRPELGSNAYFTCSPSTSSNISCSRSTSGRVLGLAVNAGGGDSVRSGGAGGSGIEITFQSDAAANPSNHSVGLFYNSSLALQLSGREGGSFENRTSRINMAGAGGAQLELFQSMRWSSSYIAYHGYSLQPGNYTVTLYFAELIFSEPGYRIFDVVIQGSVVRQDLDLARQVGPRAAYRIQRNITVTNNGSVSVELVSKGRDRYLDPGPWAVRSTGPIVSAVSMVSFDYRGESSSSSSSLSSGAVAGIAIGIVAAVLLVLGVGAYALLRRRRRRKQRNQKVGGATAGATAAHSSQSNSLLEAGGIFTYQELHDATQGFSDKLGEGGFGAVYKGTLPDGTVIAVKQLVKHTEQIEEDFKREISIISKVRHRNLLSVIGYSLESDVPMLVCEFIPNGSLDKWLFRRRGEVLSWKARREVAIGVACGLAYLHDESKYRIIHCDIKPANILLDSDFTPRLADFGLARLYDEKESHVTATRLKGTAGYLAPEYAMHLQLSDKVDVYSFGVVLLELLSGRRAVELSAPSERIVLVDWAHKEAEIPANLLDIVDERLKRDFDEQEARDMTSLAILCTQRSVSLRPKMQSVWLMLTGALKVPEFLENLQPVVPLSSGGSTSQSSGAETSVSAAFRALRIWTGAERGEPEPEPEPDQDQDQSDSYSYSNRRPATL